MKDLVLQLIGSSILIVSPRAFDLDAFDQLIWILGQVGACCALLSPIAFVAARDSVLVVSVTCSSVPEVCLWQLCSAE